MDSCKKILLIIDPQIDFVDGSLAVDGAKATMDALADYIIKSGDQYSYIIVTADCHPIDHCSFKRNGGQWPVHCVADSVGAAIWPTIMNALLDCKTNVIVVHKGHKSDTEEYSIFKNAKSRAKIIDIICDNEIAQVDICGIAGDYCVADTIRDGVEIFGSEIFRVLTSYVSSIDNGETLTNLIDQYHLLCDK